jgi:hypothetical protein
MTSIFYKDSRFCQKPKSPDRSATCRGFSSLQNISTSQIAGQQGNGNADDNGIQPFERRPNPRNLAANSFIFLTFRACCLETKFQQ